MSSAPQPNVPPAGQKPQTRLPSDIELARLILEFPHSPLNLLEYLKKEGYYCTYGYLKQISAGHRRPQVKRMVDEIEGVVLTTMRRAAKMRAGAALSRLQELTTDKSVPAEVRRRAAIDILNLGIGGTSTGRHVPTDRGGDPNDNALDAEATLRAIEAEQEQDTAQEQAGEQAQTVDEGAADQAGA